MKNIIAMSRSEMEERKGSDFLPKEASYETGKVVCVRGTKNPNFAQYRFEVPGKKHTINAADILQTAITANLHRVEGDRAIFDASEFTASVEGGVLVMSQPVSAPATGGF